jgi:hypothetical protein
MSDVKDAQERAIRAAMREERARDAARALQEVESERQTALAKTARLRELRLAKKPANDPHPK